MESDCPPIVIESLAVYEWTSLVWEMLLNGCTVELWSFKHEKLAKLVRTRSMSAPVTYCVCYRWRDFWEGCAF